MSNLMAMIAQRLPQAPAPPPRWHGGRAGASPAARAADAAGRAAPGRGQVPRRLPAYDGNWKELERHNPQGIQAAMTAHTCGAIATERFGVRGRSGVLPPS